MFLKRFSAVALLAGTMALLGGACGKGGAAAKDDTKITGKPSDPPVKIEATWKPNHRHTLRFEMSQHSEFPAFGRPGKMTNDTTIGQEYALTVTNASEAGQRGLELEFLALEVQTTIGETEIYYDSANKVLNTGDNPLAQTLSNLIGGKIHYLLGADNAVLKLEGTQALFDRLDKAGNAGRPNRQGGMAVGAGFMLRRVFSDDYFKQIVELSGLPSQAVRVGDKWPVKRVVNGGLVGNLLLETENTFKGWQTHESRKCARIEFAGTMKATGTNSLLGAMGRLDIENGKVHGTSWVDSSLNLPVDTVIDEDMDFKITLAWGGPNRGTNTAVQPLAGVTRLQLSIKLLESEPTERK